MRLIKSKEFSLTSQENDKFILRSISQQDIELLRVWKNDHRGSFFFKETITSEMQNTWFQSYTQTNDDFMMIVQQDNEKIGCIGFRLIKNTVDIYNVILGRKEFSKNGYMANALKIVCSEAMRRYPNKPIVASVLKTNPALQWYVRRGFVINAEFEEHYVVILPEAQLKQFGGKI